MKQVIRCDNDAHEKVNGKGNILCILSKGEIYIHCPNSKCGRWTKISVGFPNTNIDFSRASIKTELMPEGHYFSCNEAAIVIGDSDE